MAKKKTATTRKLKVTERDDKGVIPWDKRNSPLSIGKKHYEGKEQNVAGDEGNSDS